MNGVDEFGVVDPAQIDGGDGEIGMPELALDHEQRHSFARHLHGMSMPQLMGSEPATNSSQCGGVVELCANVGWRPRSPGGWIAQDAEQRADWQRRA